MNYKTKHLNRMKRALQARVMEVVANKENESPLRENLVKQLLAVEQLIKKYETKEV